MAFIKGNCFADKLCNNVKLGYLSSVHNSIRARAIKHWNFLPADVAVFNISMQTFKLSVGNYIVENRVRNNVSQYTPP